MVQFTFITASDIHISDQNPRSRIDNFKESILYKLSQMAVVCQKMEADGAIIAGDLFNLKKPIQNSHGLVQKLIQIFRSFQCPVYMIEGNHDITANRLETISEQPLGVLFESGALIQMRKHVIEKDGEKVMLIGIPYCECEFFDQIIPEKNGYAAQICAMHVYASPTPGMLFRDKIYGYKEFTNMSPDVFIFGHYHLDQGIRRQGNKTFVNIGSMSRGTLTDENVDHHPQIAVISVIAENGKATIEAKSVKLKIKPASEIFDLVRREEEKQETKKMEEFVDKLIAEAVTSASNDKELGIEDIVKTINAAPVVKDTVMKYIQMATVRKQ